MKRIFCFLISCMAFLMCGCSTHLAPKTTISIETVGVVKKNHINLHPEITGVECNILIGNEKYLITTPTTLDLLPKKDDELKVLCNKEGYRAQEYNNHEKAISFFDKKNQMNKMGLGQNIGLGLAFIGVPMALGLKSFYPIIGIPILSYALYYLTILDNSPYHEGYTFRNTSFRIYMERIE